MQTTKLVNNNEYFCLECFDNDEIKSIIKSHGFMFEESNTCNICNNLIKKNNYSIPKDQLSKVLYKTISKLYECRSSFLSEYWSYSDELDYRSGYVKSLENLFSEHFQCKNQEILFNEFVNIDEIFSHENIEIDSCCWKSSCSYGINSVHEGWEHFCHNVKYTARYFDHKEFSVTDTLEEFEDFFDQAKVSLGKESVYRARFLGKDMKKKNKTIDLITKNPQKELGKAPTETSKNNRFSPIGITYGYFSFSKKTALAEIRANKEDEVAIGTFHLNDNLKLVDFRKKSIAKYSNIFSDSFDFRVYCNTKFIQYFIKDISKFISTKDSPTEYIPTQIISEYIWSIGYDGFVFDSSQNENGENLVLFGKNPECTEFEIIYINDKEIDYHYSGIG